jgi:hypothetical protein
VQPGHGLGVDLGEGREAQAGAVHSAPKRQLQDREDKLFGVALSRLLVLGSPFGDRRLLKRNTGYTGLVELYLPVISWRCLKGNMQIYTADR